MILADLISHIAQLQVTFLVLLKLKDYEKKKKIKPLQHFSCLEEKQQQELQNQISFFQKTKPKILSIFPGHTQA